MPQAFAVTPYSKRSVFVTEAEDGPTLEWMTKALHRLGATRAKSVEQPGWILPKDKEDAFRAQHRTFKKEQGGARGRHSRDPDEKHKRSRGRPGASPEASTARVAKPGGKSAVRSTLADALEADRTRDEKAGGKPGAAQISYIDWDEVDAAAADLELSEDDEKRASRSESSRSGSGSSSDESSDDEMIQAVLARKMKSESSGKHIEEETVADSDEEDLVSACRRFRHIYAELGRLKARIVELERPGVVKE
jgi:hypothetical protein